MAQAQYPGVTPDQIDSDGHDGKGEKLSHQIQPEIGKDKREEQKDQSSGQIGQLFFEKIVRVYSLATHGNSIQGAGFQSEKPGWLPL
jgi:hypothetical protein